MKVLVVGAGGREHALVRALGRSPQQPELLCAPGNAGIAADARLLDLNVKDIDGLLAAVERENVDLTVVGPEVPLVAGLVDALAARGHAAFGPSAAAARLEGSKAFAKEAMEAAGVPTARWQRVRSLEAGILAVRVLINAPGSPDAGVVVKADGLAAGKGVTVAENAAEAERALREIFSDRHAADRHAADREAGDGDATGRHAGDGGVARASAIVEERLSGEELSLLALCDGERALPLAPARDFKRIGEGDVGPNTGGMGSYSPVAGFDDAEVQKIAATVHQPIVDLMRERGTPFHGVLYAGLMLTPAGLRVLEYNARFGDPETQAVLPRLRSDLLDVLLRATRSGGLEGVRLEWSPDWAVTVVLASAGYPESSSKGDPIHGLDRLDARFGDVSVEVTGEDAPTVELTHAGTAGRPGAILTAGGRVLNVTGLGPDAHSARDAAYAAAEMISFDGMQMRRDIALDAARAAGQAGQGTGAAGQAGQRTGAAAEAGHASGRSTVTEGAA